MILQHALDLLRLVLERKALGNYMGNIRWLLKCIYIYICIDSSDLQHYFLCKLKFMHNPTLLPVTIPAIMM
jgi:hypothetical protein